MRNNCILCLPFSFCLQFALTSRASSYEIEMNKLSAWKRFQTQMSLWNLLVKKQTQVPKIWNFVDVNKHFNKLFLHCLRALSSFLHIPRAFPPQNSKAFYSWALKFTSKNIFNLLHTINHSWYSRELRNEINFYFSSHSIYEGAKQDDGEEEDEKKKFTRSLNKKKATSIRFMYWKYSIIWLRLHKSATL